MSPLPFKYRKALSYRMIPNSPAEHPESPPLPPRWVRLGHLNVTVPLDARKHLVVQPYDESLSPSDTYTITEDTKEEGDYEIITYRYPRASSPSLEFLLGAMAEAMGFDDSFDVHTPDPTKAFKDKIDAFLRSHTGMDYSHFAKGINVRAIEHNDYALYPQSLKRKLFDFRATVYLMALASAEEKGHALPALLKELASVRINPLKKEYGEPTFAYIESVFKKE